MARTGPGADDADINTSGGDTAMANDADWLADVRRWYLLSQQPAATAAPDDNMPEIGYEAAHPALQSQHWPDAPRAGFTDPK